MIQSFHYGPQTENLCCGYSLEAPNRGTSNVYQQHMFFRSEIKKKIFTNFTL